VITKLHCWRANSKLQYFVMTDPSLPASMLPSTMEQSSKQYLALRQQASHFSSPQGPWSAACDGFSGEKHQCMQRLHTQLLEQKQDLRPSTLIKWLQSPDVITVQQPSAGLLARISDDSVSRVSAALAQDRVPDQADLKAAKRSTLHQQVDVQASTRHDAVQELYLVYYWRGPHDFMWFKVQLPASAAEAQLATADHINTSVSAPAHASAGHVDSKLIVTGGDWCHAHE